MLVNRLKLKSALSRLKFFYNNNSVLPSIQSILFTLSTSRLELEMSVTNLETYITEKVKGDKLSNGTVMPVDKIFLIDFYWMKKVVDNSIGEFLDVTESSHGLCVKSDNSRHFFVPIDNSDSFPKKFATKWTAYTFSSSTKKLSNQLKKVSGFSGKDYLRPALCGVHFDIQDGKIIVVATDAHRLIWIDSEIDHSPSDDFEPFIMPKEIVSFLCANNLGDCKISISKTVSIGQVPTMIKIENETTEIVGRLVDSKYPDWRVVVPENKGEVVVTINRSKLKQILMCAEPLSNPSTKQVNFSIKRNKITITCEDEMWSSSIFDIKPETIEKEFNEKIYFNGDSKILKQAISVSKSELVKFQWSILPTKAVFIDDQILVMPLKAND